VPSMQMSVTGHEGGLLTLALAYFTSCLGCMLGLSAMSRARSAGGGAQKRWLALGACAIGATGIWAMHFIAMLGFSVPNWQLTYNLPITIASLVVAVVVVGAGLTIAVRGQGGLRALLTGGAITGVGVAVMHYLGMSALNMPESVDYNLWLVLASVLIAVAAACVALWFAMNVRSISATIGAGMVMGVAVCGMHYTGMAAMTMHPAAAPTREGLTADQLLMPLLFGIGLSTLVMLFIAGLGQTEQEVLQEQEIQAKLERLEVQRHSRFGQFEKP
jgi:NO-binding membrane sensor protein with MHYT domain